MEDETPRGIREALDALDEIGPTAASTRLEPGAVVQLKSGGPSMTVTLRVKARGEAVAMCRCMFFADGKMSEVLVPEIALARGGSDGGRTESV